MFKVLYEQIEADKFKVMSITSEQTVVNEPFFLIKEVPQPEMIIGKNPIQLCLPSVSEIYYEYEDRNLNDSEKLILLQQDNQTLGTQLFALQTELLMKGVLE